MKVGLEDIPPGNVYLKLDAKYIRRLLDMLKVSNTILPEDIKSQFYRMSIGKKVSLRFMKQMSIDLDIPIDDIEKNTSLITSAKSTDVGIMSPRFLVDFTSEDGVRFIAAIMGDGELNNQLNVRYNNQDETLIELISLAATRVFGDVHHKVYLRNDRTYQLHFPKIVGIIVALLGIQPGYKSITNYGIPKYIFSLNKKRQSVFIRQFFNDEGNVRLKDRRLQVKQTNRITVTKKRATMYPQKYAHRVLIDLQKLLLNFNIDSKLTLGAYREDKADWELSIYRKENLERFEKLIGFDSEKKKHLLCKALESYKFPSAARNGRLGYALECARRVQKKHGSITKHLLAKQCNRSLKVAAYYLVDLKKAGLVRCVDKPKKNGRMLPHVYVLNR